jgi:hypothetical protein
MYMKYDTETTDIRMQQLDGPEPSYRYEMFTCKTRGPGSTTEWDISIDAEETKGNLFVFEPIKD